MTAAAYKIPVDKNYIYDSTGNANVDFVSIADDVGANDFDDTDVSSKKKASGVGAVSYFTITKCNIGFREASQLVAIAEANGSVIKLVSGKTVGTTKSILSIIKMGVKADASVGFFIVGGNGDAKAVFAECREVLSGV